MVSHATQSACGDVNAKAAMLSSCAGDHWHSSSPGFRVPSASLHIYSRSDYGIVVLRDDALHVCIRHRHLSIQQGVRTRGDRLFTELSARKQVNRKEPRDHVDLVGSSPLC
jgi:hypothetical protein